MVKSRADHLDLLFQALSDPTRRKILRRVAGREVPVTALASPYRMSLAAVSKHLKVLDRAGLIRRRRAGRYQLVSLKTEALRPVEHWLAYYRRFWDERLDRLKTILEQTPP